jgi:two-component system cell cycle response regulator
VSRNRETEELSETVETASGDLGVSLGSLVVTSSGSLPEAAEGMRICLVEIHGDNLERRIELGDGEYTIGRVESNRVVVRNASVSRHHARLEPTTTGYEVIDLDSTNGTHVNEVRVSRCPLQHEDLLVVGNTAFRYLASVNLDAAVAEVVSRIPRTDGLTQVPNRTALDELIMARNILGNDQCVIVLEIEDYDALETRYKSLAMDRVVSLLASQLKQRIRRSDFLARIGRRQFAILLEHAEDLSARRKSDSLRRHVSLSTFRYHDAQIPVSLRAAVVVLPAALGGDVVGVVDRAAAQLARGTSATGA